MNRAEDLSKILKMLRVQHSETQKEMATKLEVSGNFLSSVEKGASTAPIKWADKICVLYDLVEDHPVQQAVYDTIRQVRINVKSLSPEKKRLAIKLSECIASGITDERINELLTVMEGRA